MGDVIPFNRKKLFLIADTETSMQKHVIDFGAVICDRHGNILHKIAVLITDFYETEDLFYCTQSGFFGRRNLEKRKNAYIGMLNDGTRRLATVIQVNAWLNKAREMGCDLTAYNLQFDKGVCAGSGIDLTGFRSEFCLWKESQRIYGKRKGFINFCVKHGLMTAKFNIQTGAEAISAYLKGEFEKEPHTAFEDVLYHELPILVNILRQKKGIKHEAYNWRNFRLADRVAAC